jgi:hypothetical protein
MYDVDHDHDPESALSGRQTFRGSACFEHAGDAERSLAELSRDGSALSDERVPRCVRLTWHMDTSLVAPAAIFHETYRRLLECQRHAALMEVETTFEEDEPEYVRVVPRQHRAFSLREASGTWTLEGRAFAGMTLDRFRSRACTVLVLYGFSEPDGVVQVDSPSFAVGHLLGRIGSLSAHTPTAPIEGPAIELACALDDAAVRATDETLRAACAEAYLWVLRSGYRYFVWQLEPPEIAGDGTASDLAYASEQAGDDDDD